MLRIVPRTLFGQLVVGTVVVQTVLLGLFIWYTVVSQRHIAQERSRQRMGQQLDRLAAACAKELAHGDMAGVRDLLELSRISPTVDVARLTDAAGKTLAVSESGRGHELDAEELAVLPGLRGRAIFDAGNAQIEGVTPVERSGAPPALLWLEPNRAVSLGTLNTVVRISLTYGGFALLANLLPVFLIVRSVTRPLSKLREATHHITENPASSAGFPLPVTAINEAGELTASFNTMVEQLELQRNGLLETLALLDSMLENAPIGFAFFNPELRYVRLNAFLANLYDMPLGEQVGKHVTENFPGPIAQELEVNLQRVFAAGEAVRSVELVGETRLLPGVRRTWLVHFYPVHTRENTVRFAGVIVVDITERLHAEEALRRTEKLAATGRLAASIAHEINNPLEAVTNLLYLLGTHEPMDPAALNFVTTAQSELERVSEITQQMLRFHRQSTHARLTRVAEVMDSVVKLYQSRITSAHVTVDRKLDETSEVFGFSGEIRQVLANLIGNALDAMPSGGRLILRVRGGEGRDAGGNRTAGVRICVADTGSGMSEETLRRVFEAFYTTKQATGTGLGLWITEEIVRKHSGTIRIRSRTGTRSGTCFFLFLPKDGLDLAAKSAEA